MWAMQIKMSERPQTIKAFLDALDLQSFVSPKPKPPIQPVSPTPATPQRSITYIGTRHRRNSH
jgi:hypothetical protein